MERTANVPIANAKRESVQKAAALLVSLLQCFILVSPCVPTGICVNFLAL